MIEISDTTLRDGGQAEGITFSVSDKIQIIQALDELGIRWIEVGTPGANPLDQQVFQLLKSAPPLRQASLQAFGPTCRPGQIASEDDGLKILAECGADTVTLFGKSNITVVEHVLRCSPEENLRIIQDSISFLTRHGICVWFDAEHFFDGYRINAQYALRTLQTAAAGGAKRIILCDTRGGALPQEISEAVRAVKAIIDLPLGIHAHNDCGLAVANTLSAVLSGCDLVQGTIGGIGERCGNADLCTVIPVLSLKMHESCLPDGHLPRLTHLSRRMMEIMNIVPNERSPFIGNSAFAHKAGVHIDGIIKDPDSYEQVNPESVGNQRRFLLSDQVGRAGVYARLGRMLPDLNRNSEEILLVMQKVKEMEAAGYTYENADSSFELLALDTLGRRPHYFDVADYHVLCQGSHGKEENWPTAQAYLKIRVNDQEGINAAEGEGPVNALDNALRKTLSQFYPSVKRMSLQDFKVRVLNAKGTASLVRVSIESSDGDHIWNTVGVSENIIEACLKALTDSVDYMLTRFVSREEISRVLHIPGRKEPSLSL